MAALALGILPIVAYNFMFANCMYLLMRATTKRHGSTRANARSWVIVGVVFLLLFTHGIDLHLHGHIPQAGTPGDHAHQADFHVSSVVADSDHAHDEHEDTDWTELEIDASVLAKKTIDPVILGILCSTLLLGVAAVVRQSAPPARDAPSPLRNPYLLNPPLRAPPR